MESLWHVTDAQTCSPDYVARRRSIHAARKIQTRNKQRIKRGIAAPGESVDVVNFLPDLNQPDRFDRIALLLSQRGHRDARIEKILGGNFARLFTEVCR